MRDDQLPIKLCGGRSEVVHTCTHFPLPASAPELAMHNRLIMPENPRSGRR